MVSVLWKIDGTKKDGGCTFFIMLCKLKLTLIQVKEHLTYCNELSWYRLKSPLVVTRHILLKGLVYLKYKLNSIWVKILKRNGYFGPDTTTFASKLAW